MQTLTEDLLDLLAGRFQAAASGFRARIEIDYVVPGFTELGEEQDLNLAFGTVSRDAVRHVGDTGPGKEWQFETLCNDGNDSTYAYVLSNIAAFTDYIMSDLGAAYECTAFNVRATNTWEALTDFQYSTNGTDWTSLTGVETGTRASIDGATFTFTAPITARYWAIKAEATGFHSSIYLNRWEILGTATAEVEDTIATTSYVPIRVGIDKSRRMTAAQADIELHNEGGGIGVSPDSAVRTNAPTRIYEWYGTDANEVLTFTGLVDVIHESRDVRTVRFTCRDMMKRLIEQTFSTTAPQGVDESGAVRTEANGVYLNAEASDIVESILDLAGWPTADRAITPTSFMLDEYVLDDGSSWADAIIGDDRLTGLTGYEAGATEAGVFFFRPALQTFAADSDTDAVPDYQYIVAYRPTTWAATTVYALGDRVLPTVETDHYYEVTVAGTSDSSEPTWPEDGTTVVDGTVTWQDMGALDPVTTANVLKLDHEIDDYDLRTRVKVRGDLATAVPAWTELWHTNTFNRPVGLWYSPAQSTHIRVLDRGTKKIYNLIQATRERDPAGIFPIDISADVTYPLGLSGDPADADVFWVLEAAWRVGAGNAASIHKYDASDGSHTAEYALPDGQWSDIKVTSGSLWLANYGTGKIHKRSKTDGSAVANYTTVFNGNNQDNPTGIFADSTTLGLFFAAHRRFLLVDESDPTTVDTTNALGITSGKVSTAGTHIFGGEMDTDTDADLFACSDELGLVWKYALTEPSTDAVFQEVVDSDLEDELGFLAGAQNREHDTHPLDADHPYEIRRETITLRKTITDIAQATEAAQRALAVLAHRREVLDLGIVGHPGLQLGDLLQITDPVTDIDTLYILDTYRDNMDPRGYLGTVALIPYEPVY